MVVFVFFSLPLLWLLLQNVSLLIQKNHLGKAVGGGRFAADTGHLCTDQARYHEVGAAESPPSWKPLWKGLKEGAGSCLVGDLILGDLLVWIIS